MNASSVTSGLWDARFALAPLTRIGEHERMVIELIPILYGRVVDLGGDAARTHQPAGIAPDSLARRRDFCGCPAGCGALPARDMNAEFTFRAAHAFLERSANRRRETARVPVEAQH